MARRLIGLSYSPWTVRARWALDHHQVLYRYVEYLPVFGTPVLRAATRRWRGKLTVPMLTDGRTVLGDSFDIAQHAESLGRGAPLIPDLGTAAHWNAVADRIGAAGRTRTTTLVAGDRAAKKDSLPKGLGWALPLADVGVSYLTRKYALDQQSVAEAERQMADAMQIVSEGLTGDYLGDSFGYADIAVACAFQFIDPVDPRHVYLGEHSTRCWRFPDLADRYRPLMEWRDRLFDEHR